MTGDSPLSVLVFALMAGMVLGAVYFFILWFTLQRLPLSPTPGRLMVFSYMARLSLVLAGFYLVMDHRWERVASALAGFIVVRTILTHTLGKRRPETGEGYGNTQPEPDKP